tara:strand:+ start:81 stop:704 length:624 start_codon:yes stop_codon:yes gene_type:complete
MIGIIDLEICNLKSIQSAIYNLGYDLKIVNKKNIDFKKISHLIIPGVGSFSNISKEYFEDKEFDKNLRLFVKSGNPILGICLGMHFLSRYGNENGQNKGLGLIDASVDLMPYDNSKNFNLPHVGWNEIEIVQKHELFHKIKDKSNFYFVHSYQMNLNDEKNCFGKTKYLKNFSSIVINKNIVGFQFHPEKSSKNGLRILENFLSWRP